MKNILKIRRRKTRNYETKKKAARKEKRKQKKIGEEKAAAKRKTLKQNRDPEKKSRQLEDNDSDLDMDAVKLPEAGVPHVPSVNSPPEPDIAKETKLLEHWCTILVKKKKQARIY